MFGVYVLLYHRSFAKAYPDCQVNKVLLFAMLTGIAYGGLTELLQKYVFTGRTCSIYDFIANVAGCIIALGIILFRLKRARSQAGNS